jgi:probable HAF family extracellular repeat protein
MKDLGALAGGTAEANDINPSDVVVGWTTVANGAQRAVRWQNGKVKNLGTLGGRTSVATAINDAGIIVGYSDLKNGQVHAFVYQNGVMTDLGSPLGGNSVALDINRAGKIVGASGTHAVTWKNGVFKDLGDNGHEYATAAAINLKGQIGAIVGPFLDAQGEERDASYPYLFYQDKWTSIGGASITNEVHAINNAGLVVGSGLDLRDESFRERAFVSKPGSSTILPPLTPGGVDEDRANDINSFGTIVGSSTEVIGNGTGPNHAVLWRLK